MRREAFLIGLISICIAGIILLVYTSSADAPKRFAWWKTYEDGSKQPYDFGIFKQLLADRSEQFTESDKRLIGKLSAAEPGSTYVFIGKHSFLNREEIDSVLSFVSKGHQALMISEGIPDTLLKALCGEYPALKMNDMDESTVGIRSMNQNSEYDTCDFRYVNKRQDNATLTDWHYFEEGSDWPFYYGTGIKPYLKLGTINGRLNYARFKVGKGYFSLHTSPMLFTNFALQTDTGFLVASEALSEINCQSLIYDIGSREYKQDAESFQRSSDSPLSYILKQTAFRWAWYVLLGTLAAFFIFRAKRKQRIIPVLEQKRNTTVSFIETLSGLFYNTANHRQMANSKMQLFKFFIRTTLGIPTHDMDEKTMQLISLKSQVPEAQVLAIFSYYNKLNETQIAPEQLMELHRRISQFYNIYHTKKTQSYER